MCLRAISIISPLITGHVFLAYYCLCVYNYRAFGNVLGNCISDKAYLKFIQKQPKMVREKDGLLRNHVVPWMINILIMVTT